MNYFRIIFVVLLFIHLLYLRPLFQYPFYQSHDGENHVARLGAYVKAFRDGNIPPRWAGDLNYRYGSPVLTFFYPLPGYIGAGLVALGFSLEDAFKILAGVSFVLAFGTFFLWLKEITDLTSAIVGALLYSLAPYHFLDLYVRGDIGELLFMGVIPLVFWSVERIRSTRYLSYLLMGAIFYALTVLSHHGLALLFTPIIGVYGMIRSEQKYFPLGTLCFLVLGLALSGFFWIPVAAEQKFTLAQTLVGNLFQNHFLPLRSLLYAPWGFGDAAGTIGGQAPQVGLILSFVLITAPIVLRKKRRTLLVFWFCVSAIALFLTVRLSTPIWLALPLLKQLQFPWRFVAIATFGSAVSSVFVLEAVNRQGRLILVLLLLILSFSYIRIARPIHHPDSYYFNFPSTTYFHGEATTKWSAGYPFLFPNVPALIISGNGTITQIRRTTIQHGFTVKAETPLRVVDNTFYFPGWRVRIDGTKVPIEFQDINYRGLITFAVPPGTHSIAVTFGESPIRLFSDLVSIGTVVVTVILFIWTTKAMGYRYAKTHS